MFLQKPYFKIGRRYRWFLVTPCVYMSQEIDLTIRVPEGFETDLASIPRIFRRVIPVNGDHRLAAVVHDYLYSLRGKLPNRAPITRKQADKVFLEAMIYLKVPRWKCWTMYRAVRAGGWASWRS